MGWWLERFGRFSRRLLGAALTLGVLSVPALAANVNFVGDVGWSGDRATFVILTVNGIHNYDTSGTSGKLRVEFWGGLQPFAGSFASQYQMATYDVAPLAAGAQTLRTSEVVPFTPPPPGSYSVSMVLTEYTGAPSNDGYTLRRNLNFVDKMVIYAPADTTPPTVSITSPASGNVAGIVTISANASDNVGVSRVDFYVNGALVGTDATAPYTYSWNTATLPNGAATLYAKAFDAKSNVKQSSSVAVNVANAGPPPDLTPPTVSITSPTGGNVAGTVTVSANASDNVGVTRVDFYVNGVFVGTDATAPYQYTWNTTTTPNGGAILYAMAFDAKPNSAQSAYVPINVANVGAPPPDTTPPTVGITSPASGNVSGTVTIAANAADNVGVSRVDFYVNGTLVGTDNAAPYQFAWNTTTLPNGAATLYARAFDAKSNSAQSSSVAVTIANVVAPPPDTTPPTVGITSPASGNVAGTVTIAANAADNVGVSRVDFYVNGTLVGTDNAAPYQFAWNTTTLPNGAATLYAKAIDANSNAAQSSSVAVTIANVAAPPPDTTPPTVGITWPASGNVAGTVTIAANAADNVGVSRVDFYVNGTLVGTDNAAPYQFAWNTTTLPNGAATLYAKAIDAKSNSAQSSSVAVTIANVAADKTPPAVSITSPTGGGVVGTITVSANASDNVGVNRVELYVNGTLVGIDAAAPYQFSWKTSSIANGPAQLKTVAYDAAGNLAQSPIVSVWVFNAVAAAPDPLATGYALEYYNAPLDHYYVSASATDINALDSGQFMGWTRTGNAFKVFTDPASNANPVCRFYIPPGLGDSHFYTASPAECADAVARFPMFMLESESVFYVNLPDPVSGACPASMVPVYRVWNGRPDSNHRYMTDPSLRDEMVAKGYLAEGYGPDAVIMCAPM